MFYLLLFLIVTSLLVMFLHRRYSLFLAGTLIFITTVSSSIIAIEALWDKTNYGFISLVHSFVSELIVCDRLSAFFILIVNFTVVIGFIYSTGYLKPYLKSKSPVWIKLHYLAYVWLHISMILAPLLRNGFWFLIIWEVMALSSFLLVIFDAEDRTIMKTGINYLIQMHVGMFFILVAFLIVDRETGQMSFDALGAYFSNHSNLLIFILFFIGFGVKAGFIPMHTWLPKAHPAAPSHVSGVMSGVMIKMGIYGILRVLISVQYDLLSIGIIILVVSVISGVLGVMMAIMQHDLKRLLAYHSIENIGIIGIGIGLGMIGLATNNQALSLLGFSGGLLHVLNHSLFKSILFFNAGSVYQAAHTLDIEQLGGLIKKMPITAMLFLAGSLAICGLPPFNGFISEYLIYVGMFKSLPAGDLYQSILVLGTIVALSLIGGLAIFCFTKAFGIAFLGDARTEKASMAMEVGRNMIFPQYLTLALILLIGLAPVLFIRPVFDIISQSFSLSDISSFAAPAVNSLTQISIISGIFVLTVFILLVYRYFHLKSKHVSTGPTWGCGYTAGTPKQQYTATSYTYNFNHIAKPVLQTEKIMKDIGENELFPDERSFRTRNDDMFNKYLIDKPVNFFSNLLKRIAVMQTGLIQHYILYAFIFMLIVFLLTYFNLI